MREFKTYNPIVNFTYFLSAIGFSMFMMHPVFLLISFICAVMLNVMESGCGKTFKTLLMLLPLVIITGAVNPLFNHKGETILAYFPSGNPFTAESLYYGIGASVMLLCVILYFSCYNKVMTSEKSVYLFGKTVPVLSLVVSMILRFIPRMASQAKEIISGQKALGRDPSKGNIFVRCKRWTKVISILISWSLENAIEISDSMKSRGYGLPHRTSFSIFRFKKRDVVVLCWIIIHSAIVIAGILTEHTYYSYFPVLTVKTTKASMLFYISYLMLLMTPAIIEGRENARWIALK